MNGGEIDLVNRDPNNINAHLGVSLLIRERHFFFVILSEKSNLKSFWALVLKFYKYCYFHGNIGRFGNSKVQSLYLYLPVNVNIKFVIFKGDPGSIPKSYLF